jgi:hypothetical protein
VGDSSHEAAGALGGLGALWPYPTRHLVIPFRYLTEGPDTLKSLSIPGGPGPQPCQRQTHPSPRLGLASDPPQCLAANLVGASAGTE